MKPEPHHSKIMIVDDQPDSLMLLKEMLSVRGYDVEAVSSGKRALEAIEKVKPDLFLLDINMPIMNGFALCEKLKSQESTADIPVIFLSAVGEMKEIVKAFQIGGVDYIMKPFKMAVVLARVNTHLHLHHQKRELETLTEKQQAYVQRLKEYLPALIDHTSHDIRNPLSNTNLTVSLLERHGRTDDEKGKEYLDRIRTDMKRINDLLVDLMKVAGPEIKSPKDKPDLA